MRRGINIFLCGVICELGLLFLWLERGGALASSFVYTYCRDRDAEYSGYEELAVWEVALLLILGDEIASDSFLLLVVLLSRATIIVSV